MQSSSRSNAGMALTFLGAAAVGAMVMALVDPGRGARRRTLLRDKMIRASRLAAMYGSKQLRNAQYHAQGAMAELWSSTRNKMRSIDDDKLIERVRSHAGHVVRNAHHIVVHARDGNVTVEGSVLPGESEKIRDRISGLRGVRSHDVRVREDLDSIVAQESAPRRRRA
jgi:hypothetical protein